MPRSGMEDLMISCSKLMGILAAEFMPLDLIETVIAVFTLENDMVAVAATILGPIT